MEEKVTDENDEDHVYILSLLKSVKSPNRFTNDNLTIENSASISSNSSAVMDDDSNTSESFSPSSSWEFPGEELMDNFNRVKTGHKLDDYILDILKSENCKKKLCFESQKTLSNSSPVSDSSMDADENTAKPDSLEVSDVLNKHGLPSHKLDDVLHVALKIVKPLKMKIKKVQHSEDEKSMHSISSYRGNSKSTSVYTCHMCNFIFNSKDNKNRHMANKHSKRLHVSIRGHCGKLRKNARKTCNYTLETYESYYDSDIL
ncbi:uncharacterized protein LOC133192597 [Saccostrea echinata]|uniref:uncharacterized protein LOC133192597 n=1 Tax=Saccostrea echinata TaxID=191078 RepID=UPI002A803BD2|nr:uncharacterized protein LOC133192597 [Saccostrea echinata]